MPNSEIVTDFTPSIGTTVTLEVIGDRSGHRISAGILGCKSGNSLIIEIPGAALVPVDLRLNDEVAVRCLVGRHVVGFRSTVIRVCTSPYPYFHLSYPESVERKEIRRDERVIVGIPVQVGTAPGQQSQAEIGDISASGAMLRARERLGEAGDVLTLKLQITLGQMDRELTLAAVIRSVRAPTEADSVYRIGVQFQNIGEDDHLFLMSFVYERIASIRGGIS